MNIGGNSNSNSSDTNTGEAGEDSSPVTEHVHVIYFSQRYSRYLNTLRRVRSNMTKLSFAEHAEDVAEDAEDPAEDVEDVAEDVEDVEEYKRK